MNRHRIVNVPASSANLGPGYDVLAAALSIELELEVRETGEFSVSSDTPGVPLDRTNLCVRAFEALPPDRRVALNDDMIDLARSFDRNAGSGPIAIAADYLETVIVRK